MNPLDTLNRFPVPPAPEPEQFMLTRTRMPEALEKAGLGKVVGNAKGPYNSEVRIFKITHPAALAEIERLNPKKKKVVQTGPEM